MTPYETKNAIQRILLTIQAGIEEIEQLNNEMYKMGFEKLSCLDCCNWDKKLSICDKFKVLPPIEVIVDPVKHCKDLDYIPF